MSTGEQTANQMNFSSVCCYIEVCLIEGKQNKTKLIAHEKRADWYGEFVWIFRFLQKELLTLWLKRFVEFHMALFLLLFCQNSCFACFKMLGKSSSCAVINSDFML